ncbi:unnamed protein product [Somion occarium]|uniref:Cytochrome b561 domain-containing protein n=1 Tax=Somion occarium TaxID=3059160 RepID=A0ABP1DAY4_9APHY
MSGPALSLSTVNPLGKPTDAEGHPDVPYEPLTSEEQSQSDDMPLKDTYEMSEGRPGDAVAQLAAIASVGIFLAATWLVALVDPSSYGIFTLHPLLNSLGIALFTYGILTLQPTSRPKTKAAGLVRHQLTIFALGYPLLILGTSAIFYNKYRHGNAHFTTWHGMFGIITLALSILQIGLGAGSVWFDGWLFGGNPRAKFVWKYHRLLGYITFPLYLFTAYLGGAWSNWSVNHSAFVVRLFAYWIAPLVLTVAVFARIRTSKINFGF